MGSQNKVEQLLRAECASSTSLALTQSTQLSATQRSNERQRIRDVVLSMPADAMLHHIAQATASDDAARQYALCLYSLSSVLPEDKTETMRKCKDRLQAYAQAIFGRFATDDSWAPYTKLVCRIACSTLAHLSEDCAMLIYDHILQSIQRGSTSAADLITLIPVTLQPLCRSSDNPQVALLKEAKAQQAVTRLCGLHWPAQLTPAILSQLREVALPGQQQTLLFQSAVTSCADIAPAQLASAAFETLQLSSSSSQASKLSAICRMMDAHREKAEEAGPDSLQQVLDAQAQLLQHLQRHFARDKSLSSAWLKEFKREMPTSAMAFAVTVSATGTSSTSAAALDTLKAVVLTRLKRAETQQASAWLTQLCSDPEDDLQSLASIFVNVVQASAKEQAADLADVALHLMTAGKLKHADISQLLVSADAGSGAAGMQWWTLAASSASRLSLVGVALLDQVVRKHGHELAGVLERLGVALLGADGVQAALPQLLALRLLFVHHSERLIDHLEAVQALLDGVLCTQNAVSTVVLAIAWPFCAPREPLHKLTMAHLRQGHAMHNVSSRMAATQGLLLLILHRLYCGDTGDASPDAPCSASQSAPAQAARSLSQLPGARAEGSGLVTFMAVLRRALAQQAPVRQVLYQGLRAVMAADPACASTVLALLYPHLQHCVAVRTDGEGARRYEVDMRKITGATDDGKVKITEALPALLACSLEAMHTAAQNAGACTSVDRMQAIWQSVCSQVASSSLEDLGIEHTTTLSWKTTEGAQQQAQCYALVSLLDLCLNTEAHRLHDTNQHAAASAAVTCLQDLRERLLSWLAGATRPQVLTDAVVGKAQAPMSAEELAMLPADLRSRVPYISTETILYCCDCLHDTGSFQDTECNCAEADDVLLGKAGLGNALDAAVSMLSHATAFRRSHRDLVARWTESVHVSRAAERLLGIPDWRPLLQPLLQTCVSLLQNAHTHEFQASAEADDDGSYGTSEAQCLCAVLQFAALQGCLVDTLNALPTVTEDHMRTAFPDTSRKQLTGGGADGDGSFCGIEKVAHLRGLLCGMVADAAGREVELLCTALRDLQQHVPSAVAACIAGWPLAACAGLDSSSVTNAAAGISLLRLAMAASANAQEVILSHVAFAAASLLVPEGSAFAPTLHTEEDENVVDLTTVIVGGKTAWPLCIFLLQTLAADSRSIQWLCAELEAGLWQTNSSPLQLQQCVNWERAAAARILVFAQLLTDAAKLWEAARSAGTAAVCSRYMDALLRACKELLKASSALMKALLAPKGKQQGQPGEQVLAAAAAVSHDLISELYNVVASTQQEEVDPKAQGTSKKAAAQAKRELARAKKDATLLPDLVFCIESYDAACLKLSKAAKCSVIKGMKRTTNRDFRIKLK